MAGLGKTTFFLLIVTFGAVSCRYGRRRHRFRPSLDEYDPSEPPDLSYPTEDKIGIYLNHFELDTSRGIMFVDTYLRQAWNDPRLSFSNKSNVNIVRLKDGWDRVWMPDLFVRNGKSVNMIEKPTPQRYMTLKPNGDVWYVARVQWELYCPDLKSTSTTRRDVTCPLMFESFGYTMDALFFSWLDSPVDIDPAVRLDGFDLRDEVLYDCGQNYTTGAFPCLSIEFLFTSV